MPGARYICTRTTTNIMLSSRVSRRDMYMPLDGYKVGQEYERYIAGHAPLKLDRTVRSIRLNTNSSKHVNKRNNGALFLVSKQTLYLRT